MNKKLISLAVAAAMAAPAAAMAEATLYGKLHMSIDYADVTNADPGSYQTVDTPIGPVYVVDANGNRIVSEKGQDFEGWGVSGNGSMMPGASRANRFGIKGSEDLGNGLKAIYQLEFGVNLSAADDNIPGGSNGGISMRNSFVGLAGGWGTALVGRHDTPLKISTGKLDLFADTMADYNGTVGFDDIRADNAIAYISPSFSGFSVMGALVAPGSATAYGAENVNSDQLNGAYSLAAIYNNGPFFASAAYESLSNEMFMDSATSQAGKGACYTAGVANASCDYVNDDYDKWRIGLGLLDWNGFTLTAIYENQDHLPGGQTWDTTNTVQVNASGVPIASTLQSGLTYGIKSQELWQVQAAYSFGNNTIKGMYGSVTRDDAKVLSQTSSTVSIDNLVSDLEGDRSTWAIGLDHNFSKRTKAYVLYTSVEDDLSDFVDVAGAEWSGFSLGMIHSF